MSKLEFDSKLHHLQEFILVTWRVPNLSPYCVVFFFKSQLSLTYCY